MLTLNFCQQRILARPVLYLSYFFKLRRVELGKQSGKALELLETLYRRPMVTVQGVQQLINANYQYANRLIDNLQQIGILREMTGQRRNRRFGYGEYIDLFTTEDA